jgi:hypothetical protein
MTDEWRISPPPSCVACGGVHGSVTLGQRCLEAEVLRLRAKWAPYEQLIAEVRALPPSNVEKRGR